MKRNNSRYKKPQAFDVCGFNTRIFIRVFPVAIILLSLFAFIRYMRDESARGIPQLRAHIPQPGMPLKIMTFNLRYANTEDGPRGWVYRRDHVIDIINRYHPTIMGTQEGLADQLSDIGANLIHLYKRFGIEREPNGEHEEIFYDTSVVELIGGGNFWLSETPDTFGTRGWDAACVRLVTWCQFRLIKTKQLFYVFNTQFDHVGAISRQKSARLLWDRIKIIAGIDAIVFTLGDFNTYRHDPTYKFLTEDEAGPKFQDAWTNAASKIGDVSCTYHAWEGPAYHLENGVVGANHIDWLFSRPNLKVLETKVITEKRNGFFPSDHYPIQTEILLPST